VNASKVITWPKKLLVSCSLVLAMGLCEGAEPIAKVGKGCPYGYRSSGDYCIPNAKAKHTIIKVGKGCPVGYHEIYKKYCVAND
jgi:hypothetical protein